jgi:TrpR family trp operon transcriptional repressor
MVPMDTLTSLQEMSKVLAHTQDPELIQDFLLSLHTESEIDEIAKRWELVKLLDEGMSQRQIAKKLGLSLCKITRGSKELKKENSSFAEMIMRSKAEV